MVTLSTNAELSVEVRPHPGGLLDRASSDLPAGWQTTGVTVPWYGCGAPVLRDKCVTAVDEPHEDTQADYQPFIIEQGTMCSTIGGANLEAHARARLAATSEWAVGRQLQSDPANTGSPKLDDALTVGTYADVVAAVSRLESTAIAFGFGSPYFLHAPIAFAAFLRRYNLIGPNGESPGGGTWVLSPGYTAIDADTFRLWVTGPVWAATGAVDSRNAVDRRKNNIEAWAVTVGMVAFDPCLNHFVEVTPCLDCPPAP